MFNVTNKKILTIARYFKKFNMIVSSTITVFALSIVYFIGVGITSLIGKMFGKKFLDHTHGKKDTYWIKSLEDENTFERYRRMF